MKTYYMKIREKFIPEILSGNKKHEYRLASPERTQIKIGDTLVLISNQNRKKFIKTTVKKVTIYKGWKEALEENWEQDFKNIYSTLEEALHECYKFYPKKEVDCYGIVVFDVEPLFMTYDKVNILLDTNILIKRESGNNASYEVAQLFNWFAKNAISTYIHKATRDELSGYGDERAKTIMLTKLNSYHILPDFAKVEDVYFDDVISQYAQDKNGKIDNALLREVYDYNVDLLLTDDALMLKKAEDLYIRDRVLTSAELLAYFETAYPQNIEYKMLAVKLKTFGEVDLSSTFFDTLREDYGGKDFDDWFKRKALKKEQAYVFEDEDGLRGFLYVKTEYPNEPDYLKVTPRLTPKIRLKVGTLKINNSGFKLGERFLKIVFDNARARRVEEIYVTLFEDKRGEVAYLKSFLEQWGFKLHGKKDNGELVLVKTMEQYSHDDSPKFNYPLLQDNANYRFLPILAEYHTDLFPDNILKNEDMHLYEDNLAHRYAIEKIYLTGSALKGTKPGDVLLIYRMGNSIYKRNTSVVSGIAIVQEIVYTRDVDDCIAKCKDRSIFDEKRIHQVYPQYKTIVRLLDYLPFSHAVTLNELRQNKIIDAFSGPRSFDLITKEQYETIYKLGMEVQE